jgi:hypothetical protein
MADDFQGLAELWREGEDDKRGDTLVALSKTAIRRARRQEWIEIAIAVLLAAGVLVVVLRRGELPQMVVGALIIALLIWSSRKRYRLRRMEWLTLSGDRTTFLLASIARVRARMQRSWWSTVLLMPAVLLGTVFARAARDAGNGAPLVDRLLIEGSSFGTLAAGLSGIAVMLAYLLYQLRRQRAQLARLNDMFESYRREAAQDAGVSQI